MEHHYCNSINPSYNQLRRKNIVEKKETEQKGILDICYSVKYRFFIVDYIWTELPNSHPVGLDKSITRTIK
ncbi:MAG: hypothetical protein U9Q88_17190 [Bacillota bacterium]|nr:hypothetical protein [Bacillota bacterium]